MAANARARDFTATTRAPGSEKAFAMPSTIRGSSSQIRIEQSAKLVLRGLWRG
jgi:hypothetical protein